MEKTTPSNSPLTQGKDTLHYSGFLRPFLPLEKRELEGINLKSKIIKSKINSL